MQHLRETHGEQTQPIFCIIDRDRYLQSGSPDCTFQKFHQFPDDAGWTIKEDYSLGLQDAFRVADPRIKDNVLRQKGQFLQAWLWFGLIYTIVQDNRGPLLSYHQLTSGHPRHLDTTDLNKALQTCREWVLEVAETDPDVAKIWMIRVELVLQVAKRVIRQNCSAFDWEPVYDMSDEVALSLMVLGETLASAKASIMEEGKLDIQGWHSQDADEGWGPSRAIYKMMANAGWCPRTLHILRNQLKGHATLMYCAYMSYSQATKQFVDHKDYNVQQKLKRKDPCSKAECTFKSELYGSYATAHRDTLNIHDHENCIMQGPNMSEIVGILSNCVSNNNKVVPLVTITKGVGGEITLGVEKRNISDDGDDGDDALSYATISHVWSDGWGNENSNKLWTCQLEFLYEMLERGERLSQRGSRMNSGDYGPSTIAFWMDTLVIPVESEDVKKAIKARTGPGFAALKRQAIGQIHRVFTASKFTIIIDNDLSDMDAEGDKPCKSAMRILTSGWMKRLWTLQEAFLSERLYVAFRYHGGSHEPVHRLDSLIDRDLHDPNDVVSSTRRHLCDSLMHNDRVERIKRQRRRRDDSGGEDGNQVLSGYSLIVNAWKAARWRTTSNPAHESLALATLLHLEYDKTEIAIAGLTKFKKNATENERNAIGDRLICEFWKLFDRSNRGSIPPGLIFLPGDKVKLKGYGWAPRSFMSVFETDYPDPLGPIENPDYKGTLIHEKWGLHVRYPGFILHCPHGEKIRKRILFTDNANMSKTGTKETVPLTFPGSGNLLDWYQVRPVIDDEPSPADTSSILKNRTELAIILTRPNPKEMPDEIGLLVEIYDTTTTPTRPKPSGQGAPLREPAIPQDPAVERTNNQTTSARTPGRRRVVYCAQIIRRVHIRRDSSHTLSTSRDSEFTDDVAGGATALLPPLLRLMPENLRPGVINDVDDDLCIGQPLDVDQEWYVDGFQQERGKDLDSSRKARAKAGSSNWLQWFGGKKAASGSNTAGRNAARPRQSRLGSQTGHLLEVSGRQGLSSATGSRGTLGGGPSEGVGGTPRRAGTSLSGLSSGVSTSLRSRATFNY